MTKFEEHCAARSEAIRNAIAHNNCLTVNYLKRLKSEVLICFVHPDRREYLCGQMGLKGITNPLTLRIRYVPRSKD